MMAVGGDASVTEGTIRITFDQAALDTVCRRWHVREMALFGSVLRDDFTPESDVDVLVDLFEDSPATGWAFFHLLHELEDSVFHRKVDLIRYGLLSRYIRDEVMQERRIVYSRIPPGRPFGNRGRGGV